MLLGEEGHFRQQFWQKVFSSRRHFQLLYIFYRQIPISKYCTQDKKLMSNKQTNNKLISKQR